MNRDPHSLAGRLFRKFLRMFPIEFREEFGGEMEEVFQEQLRDAERRKRPRGLLKIWVETIADLFKMAPREHLSVLRRDAGYAVRVMRANPGFTIIALVTLALGIGANTAIFSIVNAACLRPLPFPEPDRIYLAQRTGNRIGGVSISLPIYLEWQSKKGLFDSLGVVLFTGSTTLTGAGEPVLVPSLAVTPGVFSALGVQPALGRGFREDDGSPGRARSVILSDSLWRSRFAADAGILGRTIAVNARSATVIGVMPKDFELPLPSMSETQIWYPYQPPASSQNPSNGIWCIGRLSQKVNPAQAEAALTPALVALSSRFPNMIFPNERAHLVPMRRFINERAGTAPLLLLGAVGFLLLIACANVANLLLARATSRGREIGIRMALGACRTRIVRQLLTESILLALAGAAVGIGACRACFDLILALVPADLPHIGVIRIDAQVLAFTLALSLFTGIIFGLVPALVASKSDLQGALTEGTARAGTGRGLGRLRAALVVGEVALALVLLVGAGLLLQSLSRLLRVKPGFGSDHLLTFKVSLPRAIFNTPEKSLSFFENFTGQVTSLPGVQEVGSINGLPLESQGDLLFSIEGRTDPETAKGDASIRVASTNYFAALRIPIERGRAFTAADRAGTEPVALINRGLARRYWPDNDPIGAFVWVGKPMGSSWAEPSPRRIVGVVGDIRDESLAAAAGPMIYEPIVQDNEGTNAVNFVVRTAQSPLSLEPAIRDLLRRALPQEPIGAMRSMDQVVSKSLTGERFYTILLGLFGSLGLLIITVGVYGVVSYFVVQHTHEIGVRMALGATPGRILRMVLLRGLGLTGAGIVVGMGAAYALTGLLRGMLYEVQPNDPVTLFGIAVILTSVALAASLVPARRAIRVDPAAALRQE